MKESNEEKLPFDLSWNQIYLGLLLAHALIIMLFVLFTNHYSF